ncbi:MAG: hypothetical protein HQL93_04615 [Magnetococcales bacterium]|nr:hypothetical protein [Magnetococcales bacterium]
MIRILPGLALLLLLGGAGLGFAYIAVDTLQEAILQLNADDPTQIHGLVAMTQRIHELLNLLVFSWGASFGLLGAGYLLWHRPTKQPPDWETRLTQLIQSSNKHQTEILQRVESTTHDMAADIKAFASSPPPPPSPITNALTPLYASPPPFSHAPRLAIGGPEIIHDKHDEEFEPF